MRMHWTIFYIVASALRLLAQQGLVHQTPAERKIEAAKTAIAKHPQKYQAYNDLALALIRRVRETSDARYYSQAEDALKESARLAHANYDAEKLQTMVLLGRHQDLQAREKARALNHQVPDDILIWGLLADADIALGDYEDAERCAQWMLDLRPGNTPGLIRGARLRTLYGDFEGAIDFFRQASLSTPPDEPEELAWYDVQLAALSLATGKLKDAEDLSNQALELFPGYYLALEQMAKVRMAQHRFADAVQLIEQRNRIGARPETTLMLAEALQHSGHRVEAADAYREFEERARAETTLPDNANRELVLYYADYIHEAAEALRIARLEMGRRHDVDTLDAYAWALYANADYAAARTQLSRALAYGVRNPHYLFHAGSIASKLGNRVAAARYFKECLDLNPFSDVAMDARGALDSLAAGPAPVASR